MVPAAFQVPAACEGDAAGLPEQAWGSSDSRHKELYQVEVKGSYEVSLGKGCSVFPCQTLSCPGLGPVYGRCVCGSGWRGLREAWALLRTRTQRLRGRERSPRVRTALGGDSGATLTLCPAACFPAPCFTRTRAVLFHQDTGCTYTALQGFPTGRRKF